LRITKVIIYIAPQYNRLLLAMRKFPIIDRDDNHARFVKIENHRHSVICTVIV